MCSSCTLFRFDSRSALLLLCTVCTPMAVMTCCRIAVFCYPQLYPQPHTAEVPKAEGLNKCLPTYLPLMQQLTLLPVYRQADLISLVASKPKVMATLSYASPIIHQCIREIARAPRQVIVQCKSLNLGSIFVKVASYTSAQSVNVVQQAHVQAVNIC